jgi:hypothetical protein
MLNYLENSFRLENKQLKKKPLIDKEISTLSYLKSNIKKLDSIKKPRNISFKRLSSFKNKAKKKSVESLFLEQQNRKDSLYPSLLLKFPQLKSLIKKCI